MAELLVSLLILAEIATFTIPKILSTQQNNQFNAEAKEVIAMLSEAYQRAQLAGAVSSSTTSGDLSPYMNYLATDNTSSLDIRPGHSGSESCASDPCIKLHNGALLSFHSESFGGTSNLNYISVLFDPDGVFTGKQDSLRILLYYNGRITSRANAETGSTSSVSVLGPLPGADPNWFSWN